jgi:hypothetical protein
MTFRSRVISSGLDVRLLMFFAERCMVTELWTKKTAHKRLDSFLGKKAVVSAK